MASVLAPSEHPRSYSVLPSTAKRAASRPVIAMTVSYPGTERRSISGKTSTTR